MMELLMGFMIVVLMFCVFVLDVYSCALSCVDE